MKIQFLGHGLSDDHDLTVGNYLYQSVNDRRFDSFQCFVAFTTLSGLSVFLDGLTSSRDRFKKIEFYLGIDDKATSSEALTTLLENNLETYIYYNPTRKTRAIYHPKLYLFRGEKVQRIILGSSNLTRPGLFNNVEASIVMEFAPGNFQGKKLIKEIETYFETFFGHRHQNLRRLDADLINYLKELGLILSEKQIFNSDENKSELLSGKDDSGIFTAVEAASVDFEELEPIESESLETISSKQREIRLTDYYFSRWPSFLEKYRSFKDKNNSTVIPREYEDPALYYWYVKQRTLYNREQLPLEHYEALLKESFPFEGARQIRLDNIWENNYLQLKKYFDVHKHSDVPRRKKVGDSYSTLSNFVAMQRHFMKTGDKRLTSYRKDKLERLNFSWSLGPKNAGLTDKHDDKWLEILMQYSAFKKKYRREPKQKKGTEEYRLGKWRNDQAVLKKNGLLTQERIALLNAESIIWDLEEHEFNFKVQKLVEYFEQFKTFDVPLTYKVDDCALGQFVYSVRKRGTREKYRDKLLSIGMTGVLLRSEAEPSGKKAGHITLQWKRMFEELRELSKTVDVNSLQAHDKQFPVQGNWLSNQKKRALDQRLKPEQMEMLTSIGVRLPTVRTKEERWNILYEMLTEFKAKNGHCRVKLSYDKELGIWVRTQRRYNKQKTLSQERTEKLNLLDFEWGTQDSGKKTPYNSAQSRQADRDSFS